MVTATRRLLTLLAVVFTATAAAAETPVKAVATFSILADMTNQVGAGRVEVTSIVPAGSDTHVYRPRPSDVGVISRAKIVIENGAGFEGWIERLIDASGYRGKRVVAVEGAHLLGPSEGAHSHAHDHGGDKHDEAHDHPDRDGRADPHAWHDLNNALIYVENIRSGLCSVDPEGCSVYTQNAERYASEIRQLDGRLRSGFAGVPEEERRIVTSHAGFAYFANRYGLKAFSAQGLSTGSEPSAQDVAQLVRRIRALDVRAYFLESAANPRMLEQIASETNLRGGERLFSDTLSDADGPAPTYLALIEHNARTILSALGGTLPD